MQIQILNKEQNEILLELKSIYKERFEIKSDLPKEKIIEIKNLFTNTSIRGFLKDIETIKFYDNLTYDSLSDMYETTKLFYNKVAEIKEKIDVEIFFKDGYRIDTEELKKKAKEKNIYSEFPNMNLERLGELYKNPPKKLSTNYNERKYIIIDGFVYRKYLIGIIQMIFNHMDLLCCGVGAEGSGKSNHISQDVFMLYWTLKEIGIINYEFDIKEIAFNSLQKFREAEDKYFEEPFRLFWLDEGNELHRQDWRDDEVKTFFQRLRRERHNRRIKFISLPVLGEMVVNIVISRMNFIFEMINSNEIKTGTLYKGVYKLYIIPRGKAIYSPYHKKNISQEEIKKTLYTNLKDKEYLKGIPNSIIVKKCFCNGVWGFKEKDYIKELKESNKTFSVNKGLSLSLLECFYLYKSNITMKRIGLKKDDLKYAPIFKVLNKINKVFETDPDIMARYESLYKRKTEHRDENKELDEVENGED